MLWQRLKQILRNLTTDYSVWRLYVLCAFSKATNYCNSQPLAQKNVNIHQSLFEQHWFTDVKMKNHSDNKLTAQDEHSVEC